MPKAKRLGHATDLWGGSTSGIVRTVRTLLLCTRGWKGAEARRVVEAGGMIFNERVNGMLAITRAFGDHQLKTPALPTDVVSSI